MTVACLLPVKGSLNVVVQSLMPFDYPESFPTRSDLMAKPTLIKYIIVYWND